MIEEKAITSLTKAMNQQNALAVILLIAVVSMAGFGAKEYYAQQAQDEAMRQEDRADIKTLTQALDNNTQAFNRFSDQMKEMNETLEKSSNTSVAQSLERMEGKLQQMEKNQHILRLGIISRMDSSLIFSRKRYTIGVEKSKSK